ncbi:hypothetical protein KUCAC02_016969 [Chaenocephalus aceratus]|nr:hypothetical protein KUCAC02_016969 [Chaenocephalus aceratus]
MPKRKEEQVVISGPSPIPRPPLFRSVGPPELSAGLPPHRRLRSLFCRSRAVLPANTHTFTDTHDTRNHGRTAVCPLGSNDALSKDVRCETDAFQPKGHSVVLHRGAEFRSEAFADTWSLVSESPRVHAISDRGRWVTPPLQTSEDPAIRDKQRRRKRSFKVDCAGKYVLPPSLTPREEDARLCEWLQSLGIAGENQQKSRFRGGVQEQETRFRRDRRPHFLPPLVQSDSLLRVPFFLPENSPPPSPFTHPDPPLHPRSMRRQKGGDL